MSKDRRQAKKHKSNKETILHAAHELTEDTTNDTTKLKEPKRSEKQKYFNFLQQVWHAYEYPNRG